MRPREKTTGPRSGLKHLELLEAPITLHGTIGILRCNSFSRRGPRASGVVVAVWKYHSSIYEMPQAPILNYNWALVVSGDDHGRCVTNKKQKWRSLA